MCWPRDPVGSRRRSVPRPESTCFSAHTGLDHLATVGDIWRELPMDKELTLRWWRVPRAHIPSDPDGISEWLFEEWARIDAWIGENQPRTHH